MSNARIENDTESLVADLRDVKVELRRRSKFNSILKGVDLQIHHGEIVALVGESGSGKSVLGLTILGLLPQKSFPKISGTARVLDVEMTTAVDKNLISLRKHKLGVVFQDPMGSLNPSMKIGKQIYEVTKDTNASSKALVDVGITNPTEILNRYPFELSGGQRQRVMIAMALAKSPALIVVDEPTTALDVTVQAQILQLIRNLRDAVGTAFLFVTHDLGVASDIADRIVVMLQGRILESGTTSEILNSPAHPYTRSLLSARITMAQSKLDRIFGEEIANEAIHSDQRGCPWVDRCEFRLDICAREFPDKIILGTSWLAFCHNPKALSNVSSDGNDANELVTQVFHNEYFDSAQVPLALEVVALEKTFSTMAGSKKQDFTALKNVDLSLRRGECIAVVGESGSGKSTLLRIIGELESPTSGEVVNYSDIPPRMVYQDAGSSLTPWMSVAALLGESLLSKKLSSSEVKERVDRVLGQVKLPKSISQARSAGLSGGQRQRVAIARCVIDPPAVLLCDEPTSALDASLVGSTLNLLNDLKRELNMAMIFVTHDLAVARYISDRIFVMYKGRIVEVGDSQALCSDPLHPYTKMLLASLPGLGLMSLVPQTESMATNANTNGCDFASRCPEAIDVCYSTPVVMHYMKNQRHASCHLLDQDRLK